MYQVALRAAKTLKFSRPPLTTSPLSWGTRVFKTWSPAPKLVNYVLMKTENRSSKTPWSRLKIASVNVRAVWRDPALRRLWLRNTRRIQIAFVVTVLAGLFAIPPATEAIGDTLFPPKKAGAFFRKHTKRQPASETTALCLTALFWIGAVASSAKKTFLKLPLNNTDEAHAPPVPKQIGSTENSSDEGSASSSEEAFCETVAQSSEDNLFDSSPQSASTSAATAAAEPKSISSPAVSKNRYIIECEIGRGGMGIVYEARDSLLERAVALKSLAFSAGDMETTISRFRQEARVLASLTHPNIVQIFDLIETDDALYIAMELVRGMTLADHLKQQGPLSLEEAVELFVPLAQAMAYAHDQGVLHRDFKPHNILLTSDSVPKITDFGLAKSEQAPHLTQTGVLMGSPAYMSPEQSSGKDLGPESDVYSFGITLFELLSGRPPFTGGFLKIALQKASGPPPVLKDFVPQVPESLNQLMAEMLAGDPEERISSMKVVAEQLRLVCG